MPAAKDGSFAESTGILYGKGRRFDVARKIRGRRTLLVTGRRGSPVPVGL